LTSRRHFVPAGSAKNGRARCFLETPIYRRRRLHRGGGDPPR
jgi:hypothetical protein